MTSEGLGEMCEGDSADTCAGKFPLVSMVGRAEGLAEGLACSGNSLQALGPLSAEFRGVSVARAQESLTHHISNSGMYLPLNYITVWFAQCPVVDLLGQLFVLYLLGHQYLSVAAVTIT